MNNNINNIKSLYLHIPFCDNICFYCDFPKVFSRYFDKRLYINKLINDIKKLNIPFDSLMTIYIGGGTPSSLSILEIEPLLYYLHQSFPSIKEFSIEANPESLTLEKIKLYKKYGVNRVSLGCQSSNEKILKYLGRKHTISDIQNSVAMLREEHINNFNLDFIYGIPNQTLSDIENDLNFALKLNPTHLSFYSLQIEEGTILYNNLTKIDNDVDRKHYDLICSILKKHNYIHYEVSNFAKKDYYCRHNLTYWKDEEYYACGVGSAFYIKNKRGKNTLSLTDYLNDKNKIETEIITKNDEEFEYLMLNLRLLNGFEIAAFNKRFNKDFLNTYKNKLSKLNKYIVITDRVFIKPKYIYTMDQILIELLP